MFLLYLVTDVGFATSCCLMYWSFGSFMLSLSLLGSWDEAYIFMKVIHEPVHYSLSSSCSCQGNEKIHTHTLYIIGDVKFWVMFCSWWAFLLWKESSSCSIHPEEIDLFLQPLVLIYSPSASSLVHLYSNCQALKWHATFCTRLFSVNSMPIY